MPESTLDFEYVRNLATGALTGELAASAGNLEVRVLITTLEAVALRFQRYVSAGITNASVVSGIAADVMPNRYRLQSSLNVLLQTSLLPATSDKACGKAKH